MPHQIEPGGCSEGIGACSVLVPKAAVAPLLCGAWGHFHWRGAECGLWPLASCRVRPLASCKRGVSWLLAIDAKVFLGKGDLGFNAHIGAARERFDEAQARQEPGVIGGLNRHAGAGVEL